MKVATKLFVVIVLLAFLSLSAFLAYQIFNVGKAVIEGAKQLQPEIYVPLSVTLITATLGLAAALYTQSRTRLREIESAHRERKLEIYLEFLKYLETAFMSAKPELGGEELNENDLARKLVDFRTKAVLWGSPGVLKAVSKMAKLQPGDPLPMFDVLESIQREMRKDIGLSNWGLEKDFFAKLPLSDPNELDEMRKKQA